MDAAALANFIAADNPNDAPLWTARFEAAAPGQAQLLIAGLTAVGIEGVTDGGSQLVYVVFRGDQHLTVARLAAEVGTVYLHPDLTRRVPR